MFAGEGTVAALVDCLDSLFERAVRDEAGRVADTARPMLAHGRAAVAAAHSGDEVRHRIGEGRVVMLRRFRVTFLSVLHGTFQNVVILLLVHFLLLSALRNSLGSCAVD